MKREILSCVMYFGILFFGIWSFVGTLYAIQVLRKKMAPKNPTAWWTITIVVWIILATLVTLAIVGWNRGYGLYSF